MTYILIDVANLFHRAKHVVRAADIDTKIGMAMHIIFASINKVFRDLDGSHVVFCFEGHSWRKDVYKPYKQNRKAIRAALSQEQFDEDAQFFASLDDFQTFLREQTNATVLQSSVCEADDFIARWIQTHPDSDHVIISSDSDFYQLLSTNVKQYNGITNQLITVDGIFDDRNKPIIDKKTKLQKQIGDPNWLLFEKCIRGDTSDNIFSAYPGARKKGTKNKIGMLEAFADRHAMGFNFNNFMLQRWVDHNGDEHVVRNDYIRNQELIDLTRQPNDIKNIMDETIVNAVQAEMKSQIGIRLMKFCGKYNLVKVGEQSAAHARYLGAGYSD